MNLMGIIASDQFTKNKTTKNLGRDFSLRKVDDMVVSSLDHVFPIIGYVDITQANPPRAPRRSISIMKPAWALFLYFSGPEGMHQGRDQRPILPWNILSSLKLFLGS